MKRVLSLLLILSWISPLLADKASLVILHTNDFHGHLMQEGDYAGAARIAAYFDAVRSERSDVLVLDAGDMVSGTPVSTLFKGTPIFEVMSAMGYDAATLGNHEFDYGWRQISTFLETANFPILNGNAFDPRGNPLGDGAFHVFEINGIRIGVIGLITDSTPYIIIPTGNENLRFDSPASRLQGLIDALAPETDIVILLAHIGHEDEVALAQQYPDIDLIIGGHSHTLVEPPRIVEHPNKKIWVGQAKAYGSHVGRMELEVDTDTDRILSLTGTLIPAAALPPPDIDIARLIDKWESRVSDQVDFQIAVSPHSVAGLDLKRWMERVLAQAAGVKYGYYNKGGVRDRIYAGPVTARHLWNIEPFGNTLVTMRLKGSHVNRLLIDEEDPRPPLEEDAVVEVATNSFIGEHTRKKLGDDVLIRDKGVLVRDVLIEAIKRGDLPR